MNDSTPAQDNTDSKNAEFWNTLCGSQLAKTLGVTDDKPESLKRFDDWYFDFYPYLSTHIPFGTMRGKTVLEVGLGYGTVSQRLAEAGAVYCGLDIAAGPVAMVNHRLRQADLSGGARQGSILKAPFADASFDYVVAIGCLHHTGNLASAIGECRRVLVSGGKLIFMVYNATSYLRLVQAPIDTLTYMYKESRGYRGVVAASTSRQRGAYDINEAGEGAPHTDFISKRSLETLCRNAGFRSYSASLENIDREPPFKHRERVDLLKTRWPRLMGLDVYATAIK